MRPKEDLHGRVVDTSREGFARAMDISCHSFMRMARLAEPLMDKGGTLLTMSYLGAESRAALRHHGAGQGGARGVVRYLATELGPRGIRVQRASRRGRSGRAPPPASAFRRAARRSAPTRAAAREVEIDDVGALCAFW